MFKNSMHKLPYYLTLMFAIVMFSTPKAFSQVEFFGGYSYLRVNNNAPNMGSNANGWEASMSVHLIGSLGAEADFSNHYGISPTVAPDGSRHFVPKFSALYGPRFNILSLPRVEPYVHVLFGGVNGVAEVPTSPSVCPSNVCGPTRLEENDFAMAFGGGVNVKATRHIWIHLIQADYLRINFSGNPQNDTRISTGLVLRFSRW